MIAFVRELCGLSLASTTVEIGVDTSLWHVHCASASHQILTAMFKISTVETRGQRRIVLEGKLVPPWNVEVENAWRSAREQLQGRKLVIDLTNVTLIGSDGENTLFKLMEDGAKFSCGDVFTKHVLKKLARICRCK